MKIIVISDTHIPITATTLPVPLIDHLKNCDMIIHAGDVVEKSLLDQLRGYGELRCVRGNMDSEELKKVNPEKLIFEVEGKKIGVTHGKGSYHDMIPTLKDIFKGHDLDMIIFGHTHVPMNQKIDDVLFFNPGSPTDLVFCDCRTFGMIDIHGGLISSHIVRIDQ